MQFNIRYITWNLVIIGMFVASVFTDIRGFDNLWFFVAYTVPIVGIVVYGFMSTFLSFVEIPKEKYKDSIKPLLAYDKTTRPWVLNFDNILDILFVFVFVYHGWFVLATLWLVSGLCKNIFYGIFKNIIEKVKSWDDNKTV